MSNKIKKTCEGCRAYKSGGGCLLGYYTKKEYYGGIGGAVIGASPQENCPKPKTIKQLINAEKSNKTARR
jgi:hypothetical protein